MTIGDKRWALQRAVHACRRKVAGLEEDTTWRGFLARATGGQDSLASMTMTLPSD